MKSLPRATVPGLVLLFVVLVIGISAGGSRAQDDTAFRLQEAPGLGGDAPRAPLGTAVAETLSDALPFAPPRLQMPLPETRQLQAVEAPEADYCFQLLANTQMNIVEFGDGTGSAEPWVVLSPAIYYFKDAYVSPIYSLGMEDGDEGSGNQEDEDAFGQGFYMPSGLKSVRVEYFTSVYNPDSFDEVYGALWSLDRDGFLDQVLASWTVGQPANPAQWYGRFVEITNGATLDPMNGNPMAMTFFTYGDRLPPFEFALFDDVTVTACVDTRLYLPNIMNNAGQVSGPICVPPSENPQDQFNANRGLVQTSARCNSTLSNIDRADYYTFKPTSSGPHTLNLRNLPAGTQWSAMIFLDQPNPEYAPGPTTGQCRIGTPGSGDKQVTCTLDKNKDYFVKVSAGGDYSGPVGNYEMQITRP